VWSLRDSLCNRRRKEGDARLKIVRRSAGDAGAEEFSSTFTGAVWGDPVLTEKDGVSVYLVFFSPAARTYWHRHEAGQVLYATAGAGWVGTRDGDPVEILAGDVVWTAPGEEHWHGAGSASYLLHLAVSLGAADWLQEVSEDEYARARRA
jgi:quercetin dioxygenase-like cupin family protein